MIATFLRAELDSDRWGPTLRELLARHGLDDELMRAPDLESAADNGRRRTLLEEHRGYERRAGLFFGFPERVAWHRAALSPEEVLEILYIKWDWWLRLLSRSTVQPRSRPRPRYMRLGLST